MDQIKTTPGPPLQLLRFLLKLDAAVLLMLGGLLILVPKQVELTFQFKDLPAGVSYVIGLWGCVMATMGIGYLVAASNPIRHIVWVQVGITRGALECVVGLVYLARGIVTFAQAGSGIILAALFTVGYIVLYPREPRAVSLEFDETPPPAPLTSTPTPPQKP